MSERIDLYLASSKSPASHDQLLEHWKADRAEFPTGNLAKARAFYSKKHPGYARTAYDAACKLRLVEGVEPLGVTFFD